MYPAEVERSTEITLDVLRAIYAHIKPFLAMGDLWTWNLWSWLTFAFSGMLRSVDFVNRKARLRNDQLGTAAADVLGDGKKATVLTADLPFRKTEKGLRDINADFICVPELPSDGGIFGARRNMQRFLALQGRSIGGDALNVFQRYCKCGRNRGSVLGGVYTYEKGLDDLSGAWRGFDDGSPPHIVRACRCSSRGRQHAVHPWAPPSASLLRSQSGLLLWRGNFSQNNSRIGGVAESE